MAAQAAGEGSAIPSAIPAKAIAGIRKRAPVLANHGSARITAAIQQSRPEGFARANKPSGKANRSGPNVPDSRSPNASSHGARHGLTGPVMPPKDRRLLESSRSVAM